MHTNPRAAAASHHHSNGRVKLHSLNVAIGIALLTGCHSETATVNAVATAKVTDEQKSNSEPQHDGKSAAEWIKQLENGSPVEHVHAIEALAVLGRQSEPAWRKLLETLPSREDPLADLHYTAMRYVAEPARAELLSRLRAADNNTLPMICNLLNTLPNLPAIDPDLLRKTCVAMDFENGRNLFVIPSFLLRTDTEHSLLRTEVTRIAGSKSPQVRRACLQILGSLDNVSESMAAFSAATGDTDQGVRLEAVWSLQKVYKQAPNPEVVTLLLTMLEDSDIAVQCHALHAVSQCDAVNQVTEEALFSLVSRLTDAPWDESQLALRAMETMNRITPAVVQQLLPLLDEAKLYNGSNRSDTVIETLTKIGASAIKPLVAAATDSDFSGRVGALRALQLLSADVDDAAALQLQPLLNDDNADIRVAAAMALAHISGPKALNAIPILIRQSYESGNYGSLAQEALVRIGEPTIEQLRAELKANRSDSQPICSVLARLGSPGVPILIDAVSSGPGRYEAITYLKDVKGSDAAAAVPVLISQLKDDNTRVAAAETLSSIGTDAREAAPALRNGLQTVATGMTDHRFQMACAAGLIRIAATEADVALGVDSIKSALNSANESPEEMGDRGYQAYVALNKIGPTAERCIPELVASLGNGLGNYNVQILPGLDPAAVPALIQALESDNELVVVRAASCLGKMKVDASEVIPKLEDAWHKGTSETAKQVILNAAERIDPESHLSVMGRQDMELRNLQRVAMQYIERLNRVQN